MQAIFSGIVILVSHRTNIDFKEKFTKLVRKFKKIVDFDKWAYELTQALVK